MSRARIPFNVNEYVWVKLTARGVELYEKSYRRYGIEPAELKVDDRGSSRFQLWDLMHTFGPEFRMGAIDLPFVDNAVEFEVKGEAE